MLLEITSQIMRGNLSFRSVLDVQIKTYPPSYRRLFPHVSKWGQFLPFWAAWHHMTDMEVVIPEFGHYVKLVSKHGSIPVEVEYRVQ